MGDTITEADVRLFTTLVRFDAVYHGHFKCNRQKLTELPVLWAYARDLFQTPGFGDTVDFDHIKRHYYVRAPRHQPERHRAGGPDLANWLSRTAASALGGSPFGNGTPPGPPSPPETVPPDHDARSPERPALSRRPRRARGTRRGRRADRAARRQVADRLAAEPVADRVDRAVQRPAGRARALTRAGAGRPAGTGSSSWIECCRREVGDRDRQQADLDRRVLVPDGLPGQLLGHLGQRERGRDRPGRVSDRVTDCIPAKRTRTVTVRPARCLARSRAGDPVGEVAEHLGHQLRRRLVRARAPTARRPTGPARRR